MGSNQISNSKSKLYSLGFRWPWGRLIRKCSSDQMSDNHIFTVLPTCGQFSWTAFFFQTSINKWPTFLLTALLWLNPRNNSPLHTHTHTHTHPIAPPCNQGISMRLALEVLMDFVYYLTWFGQQFGWSKNCPAQPRISNFSIHKIL